MKLTDDEIIAHIQQWSAMENPGIPNRHLKVARHIGTVEPGINSAIMRKCIESLDHLTKGGLLILSGKYGCGKTLAAICTIPLYKVAKGIYRKLNIEENPHYYGGRHKFITSHDVLKSAFKDDPDEYFKTPNLLIVDDLGWEHFTDKGFGISEWDRFFDCRYRDLLPTIITTNLSPEEFKEKYTLRIYDRLKESAIWFQGSDDSLRKSN